MIAIRQHYPDIYRRNMNGPEVLVGNILLLAVDHIEVDHIVADHRIAVDRIVVGHIGVGRIAVAAVGGIRLLLPY